MKGKTILVTGGAGFVASHLVDGLVREGAVVRVVDNFVRGGEGNLAWAMKNGRVSLEAADIRDKSIWPNLLSGVEIVYHQAALRVTRCEENPEECWEVMVEATKHLMAAAVTAGVQRFVLASSAIAYGAADTFPTPPTHHLNNNNTWYGVAKIINEQLLNAYAAHTKMAGLTLRYFNAYGTRMATKGHTELLIKWLQALDKKEPLQIFGDGAQTMDWVEVRDIVQANLLAGKSDVRSGVFNVGTGRETSLRELGRIFLNISCVGGEPKLTGTAPTNPIPRRVADISSTTKVLGYKPAVTLEKGLAEMLRWWKTECSGS